MVLRGVEVERHDCPAPAASSERAVHPPELTTTMVSATPTCSTSISRTGSSRTCAKYEFVELWRREESYGSTPRGIQSRKDARGQQCPNEHRNPHRRRYTYSGPAGRRRATIAATLVKQQANNRCRRNLYDGCSHRETLMRQTRAAAGGPKWRGWYARRRGRERLRRRVLLRARWPAGQCAGQRRGWPRQDRRGRTARRRVPPAPHLRTERDGLRPGPVGGGRAGGRTAHGHRRDRVCDLYSGQRRCRGRNPVRRDRRREAPDGLSRPAACRRSSGSTGPPCSASTSRPAPAPWARCGWPVRCWPPSRT